jgi:Uncharacterized protein conserved in bacteria
MRVEPYLFFNGRCEEAVEFYKKALGAKVAILTRFKDSPEPHAPGMLPPGSENKVMHVSFRVGDTTVMASDGFCKGQTDFQGLSLSLTVSNEAEADRVFAALADGGQVADAAQQDVLVSAFRHGHRPVRPWVDGYRHALSWCTDSANQTVAICCRTRTMRNRNE